MKAPVHPTNKHVYEFDSFTLDENERVLLRDGKRVPLTPKALEMLIVFVARAGLVLERDELMEMVWPDAFVEESNLAVTISTLRKALGEMPGGGQYIGTLPRRGYRFAAEVRTRATTVDIRSRMLPGSTISGRGFQPRFQQTAPRRESDFRKQFDRQQSRAITLVTLLVLVTRQLLI
jgi:DNA-binding winged helix-turn-helix (wHTH) protein